MSKTRNQFSDFLTRQDLAHRYGLPYNQLNYALLKAGIRPVATIAHVQLYCTNQLAEIDAAVKAVRTHSECDGGAK